MIIRIKVKTNAKESKVVEKEGEYTVYVKAVPQKGEANREAEKVLEEFFGKEARIIKGHKSRNKIVKVGEEV